MQPYLPDLASCTRDELLSFFLNDHKVQYCSVLNIEFDELQSLLDKMSDEELREELSEFLCDVIDDSQELSSATYLSSDLSLNSHFEKCLEPWLDDHGLIDSREDEFIDYCKSVLQIKQRRLIDFINRSGFDLDRKTIESRPESDEVSEDEAGYYVVFRTLDSKLTWSSRAIPLARFFWDPDQGRMIRWGWNIERYESLFENEYAAYFDIVHGFGCEKTSGAFDDWSALGFEDAIPAQLSSIALERIWVSVAILLFQGSGYTIERELGSEYDAGTIWILVDHPNE